MKILMVNKFLYPRGGAETYTFKLGQALCDMGHEVEYFGMEDERNIVGNSKGLYTSNKEFRGALSPSKLWYPIDIIYSFPARKKMARLLEAFRPDVVHLNNIHFQITPSVIYEIKKRNIKIVWTAHDYQLICPNHSLYIHEEGRICEACIGEKYMNCFKNKCLHGSRIKSLTATAEAILYSRLKTYRHIHQIICPSEFLAKKLRTKPEISRKCVTMHNFIDDVSEKETPKGDYVLYFGRFDREKGIRTLIEVCRELGHIRFIFAGDGELADEVNSENIENVGFVSGEALENLIRSARFTVYPSEWYENCPFSVMESQMYGVPVVGADIGGIPELIDDGQNGLLFEAGNKEDLKRAVSTLYEDEAMCERYAQNCLEKEYDTAEAYAEKIVEIYQTC